MLPVSSLLVWSCGWRRTGYAETQKTKTCASCY